MHILHHKQIIHVNSTKKDQIKLGPGDKSGENKEINDPEFGVQKKTR